MGATTSQIEILDDIGRSAVPQELIRGKNVLVLRIKNNSFIDEQIRDGDLILAEACSMAENGATVLAFADGRAMVTKFYIEDGGRLDYSLRMKRLSPPWQTGIR